MADGLKQGNEALKKMHEVCKKVGNDEAVKSYFMCQWMTCGLFWLLICTREIDDKGNSPTFPLVTVELMSDLSDRLTGFQIGFQGGM